MARGVWEVEEEWAAAGVGTVVVVMAAGVWAEVVVVAAGVRAEVVVVAAGVLVVAEVPA